MIFPGMDPYLEHPQFWRGVHGSLIVYFRDQLQPQLLPRYVASIEERVYVEGPDRQVIPDVQGAQVREIPPGRPNGDVRSPGRAGHRRGTGDRSA